jgi:hypothetical protein
MRVPGRGGGDDVLERFFVMRRDARHKRWWRDAEQHRASAPELIGELIDSPGAILTVNHGQVEHLVRWIEEHGLPEPPPLTIMDREDQRPGAQKFLRRMSRAYASVYASWAMRDILQREGLALMIEPDKDDEDLWHCRIEGCDWSWTGETPIKALETAITSTVDHLMQMPA